MKDLIFTTVFCSALYIYSVNVIAAGEPVSNKFESGEPARAADVNDNFQELADRIANIPVKPVFDFRDYMLADSISEKTFSVVIGGDDPAEPSRCDTETRRYAREAQGGNSILTITRTRSESIPAAIEFDYLNCKSGFKRERRLKYKITPEGISQISQQRDNILVDGTSALATQITLNPSFIMKSSMQVGSTWVSFMEINKSTDVDSSVIRDFVVDTNSLIAVEDVTVPYNGDTTYTNCIVIRSERKGDIFERFDRASWYCPGVGLVKTINIKSIIDSVQGFVRTATYLREMKVN